MEDSSYFLWVEEFTYEALQTLQKEHPGWRLLRSDHAPLIAHFLYRNFIQPNIRTITEPELAGALEDELFILRERYGESVFPRSGRDYLRDWASPEKYWLRRFYVRGDDEPQYDLLPTTERAVMWLKDLNTRSFVGTESRLIMLFELLRQMVTGSETDQKARVTELQRQRDTIDAEIQRVLDGKLTLLDGPAMRDRFQQFTQMARELLSDFREVEQNFRNLDRSIREKIALWEGSKAELLDEIMVRRDTIEDSDQGRSFRAFWDFLMSVRRQNELTEYLETILNHPEIRAMQPDLRMRRIHYDWLEAGEHTQRTVADLSAQLRRFLDDQAWLENRRIMNLLRSIENHAIAIRQTPPADTDFMSIPRMSADIQLPLERKLFSPPFNPVLNSVIEIAEEEDIDPSALFTTNVVDKTILENRIRQSLRETAQITLGEILLRYPVEQGLAEVIAYFELATTFSSVHFTPMIEEEAEDEIEWDSFAKNGGLCRKVARLPRIIFTR